MLDRTETKEELSRRLEEITWFKKIDLESPELARNFFSRIADYMNLVSTNSRLKKYVEKLYAQRQNLAIDKDLVDEGDKLIKHLDREFKLLKNAIKNKNIKLPTYEEMFPGGSGTITPTPMQFLAMNFKQISSFLNNKNQFVGDIPKIFAEMDMALNSAKKIGLNMNDHEKRFKKYYKNLNSYKAKLRLQKVTISFLRFDDYEHLEDIWRFYYSTEEIKFSRLNFFLGNILNDEIVLPVVTSEEKKYLYEFKPEYLLHIQRFHNYLIDQLENKSLVEKVFIWLWDNLGKTFISLIVILIIFLIFNKFFNLPLETIIKLIK